MPLLEAIIESYNKQSTDLWVFMVMQTALNLQLLFLV